MGNPGASTRHTALFRSELYTQCRPHTTNNSIARPTTEPGAERHSTPTGPRNANNGTTHPHFNSADDAATTGGSPN